MSDNICDDKKAFHEFLSLQAEEIERHKWIESEKAGYDLGNNAIHDWIRTYAKNFREQYILLHSHQNSIK